MLTFFRRIINSKAGVIVTFIILGVIAVAFAAGDVTGLQSGGSVRADSVAKVGKESVTSIELKSRVGNAFESVRQRQPTIDIAQFIAEGGYEGVLDQLINSLALSQFGREQGMVVSKKVVDGQIASIPGLQGPTGKFDPNIYQRLLAQRKLTDAQIRVDIARDTFAQQLTVPTIGASQVPVQIALPYASLLLEKRAGQIGVVPVAAVGEGAAPTAAELDTFYRRNVARYTVPQRRVMRYALVTPAMVKAQATPTDAEIAAAYKADAAKYAGSEKRTITQVVVADQAGASAIAARVKAGASMADAARAAGLEALVQTDVDKATYAGTASPAIAENVFAGARGAVVGPVRGPLGWTIARVDSIRQVAGRSLDQARGEIVTALTARKTAEALSAMRDTMDSALASNATFDEVVGDQKLTAQTTAALVAGGTDPNVAGSVANPALAPIVLAGFQSQDGDPPQVVPTAADGSFALVALSRVVPAAPRPLAQVSETVARDFRADRARGVARQTANAIMAKVNRGTPLAQAMAQSGLRLPPPRPLASSRMELANSPQGAPPPLALMFSMVQGTAKAIESPAEGGWAIVKLDRIERGNAQAQPQIVGGTRSSIARLIGREYVEQFANAVRAHVGVKIDRAALARVRGELTGAAGTGN
ncbi:MAG TPA: SurA N-terminal domain-containing protein [Sphingomonas sp.]|jgi:peptidyl-prolyl cis-trans isomerase D|nr:SurA N-terminal domain-containing protein [Sphingomonas sp.]